jgi:murein DD-endopeptidase MepM/ murein hydrolase activator NlpD
MPGPAPPPTTFAQQIAAAVKSMFGGGFAWVRGFDCGPSGTGCHHSGIDLSAARGTPIHAAADGVISYAANEATDASAPGFVHGGGNVVNVASGKLVETYAHMDTILVKVGQSVKKGDVIGTVGMTGGPNQYAPNVQAPTGYHLHFGVWDTENHKFLDPLPFVKAGAIGDMLGAWGNIVQLPTGTILTPELIDDMIRKLDAAHFFQAKDIIPGLQQLSENAARDKTRAILMQHVGQPWNKSLQDQLQTELFGAAAAAVDNPAQHIADLVGKLFDPGVWIRILALLLGAVLAIYGGANVLRASAA